MTKKSCICIKKMLCIFLAVMMLFFGVNNSYFSPQKIDTVEATSIAVGGAVITVSMVIKLIAIIVVAGLSCAIIENVKDWDWEVVIDDLHTWCRENYESLQSYLAAQPALKKWILADEWVVVIDTAGSSSPQPSPSPDKENENLPSTDVGETGLTQEEFELLLNEHHGFTNAFRVTAGSVAGGLTLSSILAPLSFIEQYGRWEDEQGNIISEEDPRISKISITEEDQPLIEIAKAYINDKISNFTAGNPLSLTDPITNTLSEIFVSNDDDVLKYTGTLTEVNGSYDFSVKASYFYAGSDQTVVASTSVGSRPFAVVYDNGGYGFYCCSYPESYPTGYSIYLYGTRTYKNTNYSWKGSSIGGSSLTDFSASVNVPVFNSSDTEGIKAYVANGDDSACINKQVANRKYNYIDTSGDYGWASTADLSPADLLAANPGLAGDLTGKDVSIAGLVAAINALTAKLEEENPNTSSDPAAPDLVPFPDNSTYPDIVKDVIKDPAIFPTSDPVIKPDPDPGTDPEPDPGTETGKDYTGLLGIIINLLRSILQAIKDFMSWFIIDFDAIKAHLLLALQNVPAFSGFDGFLAILDRIRGSISDSYEYPKITIKTPAILKQFLKTDEILLLDFEDYATYFLWVRTAMGFAILFGFFMWVVRDIKVELTLN